jgi:hypothetical protein
MKSERKNTMTIDVAKKLVEHKVILDLSPDLEYTGIPQWRDLDLSKGGAWYCSYQGFLDETHMAKLRANYEVKENDVSSIFKPINEEVRRYFARRPSTAAELNRILRNNGKA